MDHGENLEGSQAEGMARGRLNEEVRARLREKISALGVAKHEIANFFGVTTATLSKWENGTTARCSIASRDKMMGFIRGEYDDFIIGNAMESGKKGDRTVIYRDLPEEMLICMERMNEIYVACSSPRPEIGEEFIERLDRLAVRTMREIVSGEGDG